MSKLVLSIHLLVAHGPPGGSQPAVVLVDTHIESVEVTGREVVDRHVLLPVTRVGDPLLEKSKTASSLLNVALGVLPPSIGRQVARILALVGAHSTEVLGAQIGLTEASVAGLSLEVMCRCHACAWAIVLMADGVQALLRLWEPVCHHLIVQMDGVILAHHSLAATHPWW